jgi:conjugal transfer ATP-binding protein TraC
MVEPYQLLLYSTKAEDVNAIKKHTDRGLGIDDAILNVLKERGYGK